MIACLDRIGTALEAGDTFTQAIKRVGIEAGLKHDMELVLQEIKSEQSLLVDTLPHWLIRLIMLNSCLKGTQLILVI